MIPGINQKQMQGMMRKMGIKQVEIPAIEVIIKTEDMEYIITNPQVSKVNMMGQENFQISGIVNERARSNELEFSEDDIKTVVEQTNCSEEEAREMLWKTKDLAEAIIELKRD